MSKLSSKTSMKNFWEALDGIHPVKPESDLYPSILQRIQSQNTISVLWVRAAAASIFLLFSVEFLLIQESHKSTQKSTTDYILPSSNYAIIDE